MCEADDESIGTDTFQNATSSSKRAAGETMTFKDFRVQCPLAIRYVVATHLRTRVQRSRRRCRTKFSSAKYCDALAGAENMLATALLRIVRDMRCRGLASIVLPSPLGPRTASQLAKEASHARSVAFKHRTEKLGIDTLRQLPCPPEFRSVLEVVGRAGEFVIPRAVCSRLRSFSPVLPPIDEYQPVDMVPESLGSYVVSTLKVKPFEKRSQPWNALEGSCNQRKYMRFESGTQH